MRLTASRTRIQPLVRIFCGAWPVVVATARRLWAPGEAAKAAQLHDLIEAGALTQAALSLIDHGMSLQEAVEAPRFQTEHFYSSFAFHEFIPGKLNLEGRVARATAEQLTALGHKVNITGEWSNGSAPTVIEVANGVLQGGADPRRSRFIFGR